MNKALLLTTAALAVSLAVNAWQYSQRRDEAAGWPAKPGAPTKGTTGKTPAGVTAVDRSESRAGTSARNRQAHGSASQSLHGILTIGDPVERYEALLAFVKHLSSDQIGETLEELRAGGGTPDPEARFLAHLLLTRWGQEDPGAALASLAGLPPKQGVSDAGAIMAALAATDPARAVAWLNDPGNKIARQPWMGHRLAAVIAEHWARQDPDAALAWAAGLPGDQRLGAYSGIIENTLESDPARAAAVAMELDPADRPKLLGQIAEAWARQSPAEAVAWADSLGGKERVGALHEALSGWALAAPAEAAAFLDQLPARERPEHVFGVARNWSRQAPAAAALWLGNQPESEGKAEAMGHVMWHWTTADPEAAAGWLGQQPAGESYDMGVAGLAKAAAHAYDDPETAVHWAATIENEQLRGRMTEHTMERWLQQNPEAARTWAKQNGLEVPGTERDE